MSSSSKYPVAIQAKLPMVASEKSRQPFRAPKRKLEEEDNLDEEETEDNVCSLYSQSPESSVIEPCEGPSDATISSQRVKESNQPVLSRQVHVRVYSHQLVICLKCDR